MSWCGSAAEYSPFYGIEKGAVLQEARCFNDPHIDPRRCQQVGAAVGLLQAASWAVALRGSEPRDLPDDAG